MIYEYQCVRVTLPELVHINEAAEQGWRVVPGGWHHGAGVMLMEREIVVKEPDEEPGSPTVVIQQPYPSSTGGRFQA